MKNASVESGHLPNSQAERNGVGILKKDKTGDGL